MKVSFAPLNVPTKGTVVIPVVLGQKLGEIGGKLDKKTAGGLKRAMVAANFTGKRDETAHIIALAKTKIERVILLGLGKSEDLTVKNVQNLGGVAAAAVLAAKTGQFTLIADLPKNLKISGEDFAAHLAFGARLRAYRFDKYHTKKSAEVEPSLKNLTVESADNAAARRAYATLDALAEGVELARNLVSEPPNILYPVSMAAYCAELKTLGVKVDILDEKAMAKLGMGALLGVAQGSVQAPRLAVMSWQGNKNAKDQSPVALVGKGVTFDTGGISLKPGPGMEEMKFDMAGAAAVIGTLHALAKSKAAVNVVGLVGLVENMPSGTAQRPGDIVTSMSGQTIEVLNTDAEGRLVLADVVWYAQETFKPRAIIDLATLTGAILIALGHEYAGMFVNDHDFAVRLHAAGEATGEKLWRLPLDESYDREINCDVADMKNIAGGREAGSIIGAKFIQRFVKKGTPWAHLDIAGTAWTKKPCPTVPRGATGYGVRLLYQYLTANPAVE
ncbi:MAG: leucyl aminopeptidase [Alphaproteobacteria bacterium]